MTTASTSRRSALLCALVFLVCALATYPVAEIGMNDDWSYVQTARILAQTGHIVYNGQGAPILGWQLFLSVLLIKLFGPSFTAIRASILLVALLTTFLVQRTLVRTGISSLNATIGTLTLVLSPLFMSLALSFMTDISGLFCVVLCLYACLRALQAHTDRTVLAWLAFAALSNAIGGTVRQVVWLGVLVMFPCALWLLRRRPNVLLVGAFLYLISIVFVFATLHWYLQQPFSIPTPRIEGIPDLHHLKDLILELLSLFLSFALFLLPVLIAFVPAASLRSRRSEAFLAFGGLLCLAAGIYLFLYHLNSLNYLLAPFRGNTVTQYGLVAPMSTKGWQSAPKVLTPALRILITIPVLFTLLCFLDFLRTSRRHAPFVETPLAVSTPISWRSLLTLLVPFTLAYVALLLPLALHSYSFDRYLVPLLPVGLILLLRIYQDRVRPDLPIVSYALVLLFALYAVACEHDAYSMFRARLTAIAELRAAGIPDIAIDAGWEHNAMLQLEHFGYINDPQIRLPAEAHFLQPSSFPSDCKPEKPSFTPVMIPGYALSFIPEACGGLSRFAPVTYRNWIGPRTVTFYIVNTVKPASAAD
jgi:hypothetical protein